MAQEYDFELQATDGGELWAGLLAAAHRQGWSPETDADGTVTVIDGEAGRRLSVAANEAVSQLERMETATVVLSRPSGEVARLMVMRDENPQAVLLSVPASKLAMHQDAAPGDHAEDMFDLMTYESLVASFERSVPVRLVSRGMDV